MLVSDDIVLIEETCYMFHVKQTKTYIYSTLKFKLIDMMHVANVEVEIDALREKKLQVFWIKIQGDMIINDNITYQIIIR